MVSRRRTGRAERSITAHTEGQLTAVARRVPMVTAAIVCVGLLTGCTTSPSPGPTAFEELSGFDVPESATDVAVEAVPGSSVGALRARFTIPETDLAQFCGTPLPLEEPFTDEERQTFALPDDLSGDLARDCESMRSGTNVSRRVIIAPADGEQVRLHVVVFRSPR